MDLLKDYARKELFRLGKVHAYYEAYEELWQQLDAEFWLSYMTGAWIIWNVEDNGR